MHPQQKVTVVWVGSGAGWVEHACRKILFVLSASFCWLDMQRQQAPKTGSRRNPHHTLQPLQMTTHRHHGSAHNSCLITQHNATTVHILTRQSKTSTNDKHMCARAEQPFLLAKNISQTGGETAGGTLKIQTGGTVRQKAEEEEQAERPQSLQEKLWVLAVCDSMKIVDVPEEGSRRFIYGTAQRKARDQQGNEKEIKGEKGW